MLIMMMMTITKAPVVFFIASFVSYVLTSVQMVLTAAMQRDMFFDKLHPKHTQFYPTFALLYCQLAVLVCTHGVWAGFALLMLKSGISSEWYLTIAFVNHNSEAAWRLPERLAAQGDWAQSQLTASSDIGAPGLSFVGSARYLWLNYHTVHHLFPHTDMSKHPGIQRVLVQVCKEFGITYCRGKPLHVLYLQMLETFRTPRDLLNAMAQLEM